MRTALVAFPLACLFTLGSVILLAFTPSGKVAHAKAPTPTAHPPAVVVHAFPPKSEVTDLGPIIVRPSVPDRALISHSL